MNKLNLNSLKEVNGGNPDPNMIGGPNVLLGFGIDGLLPHA